MSAAAGGARRRRARCPTNQTRQMPAAGAVHHGGVSLGRLSIWSVLWDSGGVNSQITIRRLLAIVLIAGLVFAPLSSPVMAGAMPDAAMSGMANDMSMSATADEMASDMPCCPSKAPAPIRCDKGLFMAACMSKCFTGLSSIVFHPWLAASKDVVALRNDSWPDDLGRPPPEHPPRTLV